MTPAEFRCLREYLGLSTQWVAVRLGVGPRAVQRWESPGADEVPVRAALLMREMCQLANKQVILGPTMLTVPSAAAWQGGDYPPAWHRHIAARISAMHGKSEVVITYE